MNSNIEQLVRNYKEIFWQNSEKKVDPDMPISEDRIIDAIQRLDRFAPFLRESFPDTAPAGGTIESELRNIPTMKSKLEVVYGCTIKGDLLLKMDSHLPISGSIKARGGIYEVLKHAEKIAVMEGMLRYEDDYSMLVQEKFKRLFGKYTIAVGSTGNLGLSIGIIGAALGFRVTVHMSSDAKQWKKDMLRSKGVKVIEYDSDYSVAVEKGRESALGDSNSYFVDDENSLDLFLGYATAAYRLKSQIADMGYEISEEFKLHVYLPCGVGGGPGGIAYGLRMIYGNNVKLYFAEPTHSPCMLIGMMTKLYENISVDEWGLDNVTAADGLAVGRPSGLVGRLMAPILDGIYTISDERLFDMLLELAESEKIKLEPSALAGMYGPISTENCLKPGVHIVWATGGGMVPDEEMNKYLKTYEDKSLE